MTILKSCVPMVVVILACLLETGCSTLDTASNSAPPITGETENVAINGMYAVNVFPAFSGEPTSFKAKIRGNMTVQNALEESGAIKSARNAEIKLHRIVQGTGRIVKMPVEMQTNGSSVSFQHDYALHSGDRLVVRGKTKGVGKILDGLFSSGAE